MKSKDIKKKILFLIFLLSLTGCTNWNEEFEGEVVRAYPSASIHKINQMADNGIITEKDDCVVAIRPTFCDDSIMRGSEDVRRMYVLTYEDQSNNLHTAHHVYFVARSASWIPTK